MGQALGPRLVFRHEKVWFLSEEWQARSEPVQHGFPSAMHGTETVAAQRDFLEEAMPEMTH